MRRFRPAPLAFVCGVLGAAGAAFGACDAPRGEHVRLETSHTVLYYRMVPRKPGVGAHFALDVHACSKNGAPPTALAVDATMPEHGHGMNTRAAVSTLGPGHWRAEGLQFHMPGRWRIVFALDAQHGAERLTHDTRLE